MSNKRSEIIFRDKKMNLLEAKALLIELKTGVVKLELTKEEKKDYREWEESKRKINEKAIKRHGGDVIFKYITEKEYIENILKKDIDLIKWANKVAYCEKHGHKEVSSHIAAGRGGTRVYAQCGRCGMAYKRGLTRREVNYFNKKMNTPMI
jgi:hypothetical protein